MLNNKGPAAAAAAEHQYSQMAKASHINGQLASDTGSELGNTSDHSSSYSSRSAKALQALPNLPNGINYPSTAQLQHPMSMLASSYPTPNMGLENGYVHPQQQNEQQTQGDAYDVTNRNSGNNDSVKAFACTTCNKGFARRSDLARHGKFFWGV